METIMDWFTLAATLGGALFGAGIAWGAATTERRLTRRRFDSIESDIERLERRLDGLYNGKTESSQRSA